jgi:hypothetical protein
VFFQFGSILLIDVRKEYVWAWDELPGHLLGIDMLSDNEHATPATQLLQEHDGQEI